MAMAISLRNFFEAHPLEHETLYHPHTESSQRTASAAGQPGDKVAKSVLLRDDDGYLLAVLPASHRVHLGKLHQALHRNLGLATEREAADVFTDCAPGAIPPAGLLYGIDTVVADSLLEQPDVYFEAGDHEQLVHMNRREFSKLLGDAIHSEFSYPA